MVSVVAPRPTRFRYPVKVSGPADEGSANGWVKGWWVVERGNSGCYLGLMEVSRPVRVKVSLWVRWFGLARWRLDSLRRLG